MSIAIDGHEIKEVSSIKFLGIHLDNDMKWDTHTKHVAKKMSSGLFALNSLKNYLSSQTLTSIYHALIHCHLNYGCLLWGSAYKKYLHKISILQKKAIRIINHARYNDSASILFKQKKS